MRQEESFQICPEMLRRVAQRLNVKKDPSFPRTDDFVFTACDISDGIRFNLDLRGSLPPEQLQLLEERGLVEK